MFALAGFKEKHPLLFMILDKCLVFFVLLPSVVFFWCTVWVILDYWFEKQSLEQLLWIYVALGVGILTILNFFQYDLTDHFLEPHSSIRNILIKRVYTAVACCGNLFLWKGVWLAQEFYHGMDLRSALFSFIVGTVLLVCLRSSCNGIAAPLGTAFDEHHLIFIIPTRFKAEKKHRCYLLIDSLFSVAIVGSLVVFEWRGIWAVQDLLLYPDHIEISIVLSLIFGYCVCTIVDLGQEPAVEFSAYLEKRYSWWLRLAFEDIYLLIAKIAVLACWRGLWIGCDMYILKPNNEINIPNVVIMACGSYLVPLMMFHANSLFILEVNIDGGMADGQGCKVKVTVLDNYIEFWGSKRKGNDVSLKDIAQSPDCMVPLSVSSPVEKAPHC